jgi:hypothetical protein
MVAVPMFVVSLVSNSAFPESRIALNYYNFPCDCVGLRDKETGQGVNETGSNYYVSLRLLRHCPALSRGVSLGARALTEHNFMYLCIQIC